MLKKKLNPILKAVVGILILNLIIVIGQPVSAQDQDKISLNLQEVEIKVLVQFISKLTGKSYVISEKVKGRVNIISPGPVTIDEAVRIFESVLSVNGYTTIEDGAVVKVVEIKEARREGVQLLTQEEAMPAGSEAMITQMVTLKNASANEIRAILIPLANRSGNVTAHQETNSLIITDIASNVRRLSRIAMNLDVPGTASRVRVINLTHAQSTEVANVLQTLFVASGITGAKNQQMQARPGSKVFKVISDERTNSIILLADNPDLVKAAAVIKRLDIPEREGQYNIHVINLRYAVADEIAQVLNKLTGTAEVVSFQVGQEKAQNTADVVKSLSGESKMVADKATNSLIISASPKEYKVVKAIVEKLDVPRTMVYVEAVILEMSAEKSLEFGTDWTYANDDSGALIFGGAGASPGNKVTTGNGFNFGVIGPIINFNGLEIPNISLLLRAVQSDKEIRVVATPQVLTADNEEAVIIVADNIPFVTRSDQGSEETSKTIQVFEYRDVGYTMKVTPRISENRRVRLSVSVEHKSVVESQIQLSESETVLAPTTRVRSADTVIITPDNNIVVIGGLIANTVEASGNQVPCLGSIPILGWGFKSEKDKGERTNMLIFLSPHILSSAKEANDLTDLKKKESRQGEIEKPKDILAPLKPKSPDPYILERMEEQVGK